MVNKEKLIRVFRKNIFNFCQPEVCLQENSTIDTAGIRDEVGNMLEIFSSEKYIRLLEEIFKVNIFVFKEDSKDKKSARGGQLNNSVVGEIPRKHRQGRNELHPPRGPAAASQAAPPNRNRAAMDLFSNF